MEEQVRDPRVLASSETLDVVGEKLQALSLLPALLFGSLEVTCCTVARGRHDQPVHGL